ncbi:MAG: NUDIX domain-containing protein [Anaerolineae bacterium]|nr:NUDIX domain-containing protein [Anaerolineae bacterium]
MQSDWYIVNVEGAVVKDGRYLLIVRREGEEHAAGALAFPGGKVEDNEMVSGVLEETLRRELREEVDIEVDDEMMYVDSASFVAGDDPVVDIVFLCRYRSGEPRPCDPEEVAAVQWMTLAEIFAHPKSPPWMDSIIRQVEKIRGEKGW